MDAKLFSQAIVKFLSGLLTVGLLPFPLQRLAGTCPHAARTGQVSRTGMHAEI